MRKQDHLIALIQSLTPAEKRFFAQHAASSGMEKSYLKLYEALLKAKSYDANALCKNLGKKKADLANEKKYLDKILLRGIRQFNEKHPDIALMNKLGETILLIEKNLPEPAAVSASQTIALAESRDQFHIAYQAHGLMMTLATEPMTDIIKTKAARRNHLKQMEVNARQLLLIAQFETFTQEVFEAYQTRTFDITAQHREETRALLNHPLLKTEYKKKVFLFYQYDLQSLLYARIGDSRNSSAIRRKMVALYEKQPSVDLLGYWTALVGLTHAIVSERNARKFERWMQKLQSKYYYRLPVDAPQLEKFVENYSYSFYASAYYKFLLKGEATEKTRQFTAKYLLEFQTAKKVLTGSHFLSTTLYVAACCLILKKTDECIELLNRLFSEADGSPNPLAWKDAKMLFIMAHAELNHYQLLPSLIQSTIQYLKKTGQYGAAEKSVLKELNKLSQNLEGKERKAWFSAFGKEIEALQRNPETKMALERLPLVMWAERG